MKLKHIIATIVIFTSVITVTASILPSSNLVLLPPLCFTDEMYSSQDISPNDIITNDGVKVKVRFKIFDIIKGFINNLFNKQMQNERSDKNTDTVGYTKNLGNVIPRFFCLQLLFSVLLFKSLYGLEINVIQLI